MREILASIIAVEQDARARVEEAQKKAAEIKARADAEAESLIAGAREQAVLLSRKKLEEARTRSDYILCEGRKRMEADEARNREQAGEALARAAEKGARLVLASVLDGLEA